MNADDDRKGVKVPPSGSNGGGGDDRHKDDSLALTNDGNQKAGSPSSGGIAIGAAMSAITDDETASRDTFGLAWDTEAQLGGIISHDTDSAAMMSAITTSPARQAARSRRIIISADDKPTTLAAAAGENEVPRNHEGKTATVQEVEGGGEKDAVSVNEGSIHQKVGTNEGEGDGSDADDKSEDDSSSDHVTHGLATSTHTTGFSIPTGLRSDGGDHLPEEQIAQETNQDLIEQAVNESLNTLPGAFRVTPRQFDANSSVASGNLEDFAPTIHSPPVDAESGLLGHPQENQTEDHTPHVPSAYLVEDEDVEIAQAEQVQPFFQRKEGKLTIIVVGGLMASLAVLLGVFLTRDSWDDDNDAGSVQQEPSAVPSVAPSFDPRSTLDIVRDRGVVNCGIEDTSQEGDVNLGQFNIDSCRAVSASIFGDPNKINLVIVGADDRYERLVIGRDVDVLYAGVSFTLEKSIREVRNYMCYVIGVSFYR